MSARVAAAQSAPTPAQAVRAPLTLPAVRQGQPAPMRKLASTIGNSAMQRLIQRDSMTDWLPNMDDLPGLGDLPGVGDFPGLPGLPGLPEMPQLPGLPGMDDLDKLPLKEIVDRFAPGNPSIAPNPNCPTDFCAPFSTWAEAQAFRAAASGPILAGIAVKVDSRVVDLWRQHIFGGSAPQDFTGKFGADFTRSGTTKAVTSKLAEALQFDLQANPPTFPPGVDTITIDLATRIGPQMGQLETQYSRFEMDFNIVNEIPGNLAGGIGKTQTSQQVGAQPAPFDDSRAATGTATITRNPDGSLSATVNLHYTVKDTIDLCPGNCGADMEMIATRPLSWLEASGVSGDVPFTVEFDAPPVTVTTAPRPPTPTPTATEGVVTASSLRIRQSPNTSAPVVGNYSRGTRIQIECQVTGTTVNGNDKWNKTDRGYVSDAYVTHSSAPGPC